jgi:DNA-binding NarL/FixJ family response regulator
MPHTVVLVEDDAATREHLARAIAAASEFRVVASEATLAGGLLALRRHSPALLLTDLGLPDGSGMELIRAASANGRTLPLVITVFGDEEHAVAAIRAGALGYLLKSDSGVEIALALREVLNGGSPISPSIARYLLGAVRGNRPEQSPDVGITERELEVLRAIVKGFSYDEIARLLDISSTTVATHVRRIYRKLSVHSRSEATYEALQQGIIRADD